ncbi:altronate dehydratase family protein [Flagellimonas sp. HMM57]|uniref:UxaA family hydrolase n=1 Tax=unclassified Flagellimonas TaxID=2644544 RepID=UPI0013D276D0|nr:MULTISPECIES: altronate dehydratase family protein [unclassified Flagellimonas]UII75374.1 altronate dehydratase family protein [Flagellimonas sp. HMM57]
MSTPYVQIDSRDNVAVAISNLRKDAVLLINDKEIVLKENIKGKHKFTLNDFSIGDDILMYGVLIGRATKPIPKGCAITIDNVKHASANFGDSKRNIDWSVPSISKFKNRTFDGYHRKDGSVGTRNYWLVIPLTFCENRNLDVIDAALSEKLGYITKNDFAVDTQVLIEKYQSGATAEELFEIPISSTKEEISKNRVFPNVDGIKFLKHDGGCGGTREDSEILCKLLAGYITNPNVAGATVLSLGCQNAQMQILNKALLEKDANFSKPVHYLEQQQSKSERAFIEEAVKLTFVGLIEANKMKRKPAPLNKLTLGLECGGSDGFSGISANPSLGYASDLLVALGGSPVLAEFPELNGVEQNLIDRCITDHDAKKFADLMRAYSDSAVAVGSGFENNPSPGNIKDGLITDAMKSAGAAKKGGTSPVVEVLNYTETVTKPGLNLLCTPGNDVESTTGLAGSGCNMIVFTTGLGTPTGNPITPVLKLSSNTALYQKMGDIIDMSAGTVISGEDTIESMGEKILEHIIKVASGETMAKADIKGQNDFIPWKRGVSL